MLHEAHKRAPTLLPPLFTEHMTVEESAARFTEDGGKSQGNSGRLREIILSKHTRQDFQSAVSLLWKADATEVEALVRGVGFDALADTMRERRFEHIIRLMLHLGFVTKRGGSGYAIDWEQLNPAMTQHCKR